jgi:hypothetical protein
MLTVDYYTMSMCSVTLPYIILTLIIVEWKDSAHRAACVSVFQPVPSLQEFSTDPELSERYTTGMAPFLVCNSSSPDSEGAPNPHYPGLRFKFLALDLKSLHIRCVLMDGWSFLLSTIIIIIITWASKPLGRTSRILNM